LQKEAEENIGIGEWLKKTSGSGNGKAGIGFSGQPGNELSSVENLQPIVLILVLIVVLFVVFFFVVVVFTFLFVSGYRTKPSVGKSQES
jgi:flagellar basal body-associated protein FliL